MSVVRVVEAQFDDGVLRPAESLGLRPGERVNLTLARTILMPLQQMAPHAS